MPLLLNTKKYQWQKELFRYNSEYKGCQAIFTTIKNHFRKGFLGSYIFQYFATVYVSKLLHLIILQLIDQLEYNTERVHLIIPEYGRHIQKMVDQATEIEDREERNKTAKAIIAVMGNLQPHLRDVPDFQHKLWDQLFIISDFKLDVDSPYPRPSREELAERPEPLGYPQNFPKYRFYGNNIKRMIDVAKEWEKGEMRDALEFTIANHMKK